MPKLSYIVEVTVTLEMPKEFCGKLTKEDVYEMAGNAVGHHHSGKAVQVIVDGVAQWSDMHPARYQNSDPIFANVLVDGFIDDGEIEIEDDGFDLLEDQLTKF